ncbi:MAG: TIR domain-containing protein [Chthonomonas sp.]|nr:TIR domain-containing protein [Chthonomonas sp.]
MSNFQESVSEANGKYFLDDKKFHIFLSFAGPVGTRVAQELKTLIKDDEYAAYVYSEVSFSTDRSLADTNREAVRDADVIIVLLDDIAGQSPNVATEIGYARAYHIPVILVRFKVNEKLEMFETLATQGFLEVHNDCSLDQCKAEHLAHVWKQCLTEINQQFDGDHYRLVLSRLHRAESLLIEHSLDTHTPKFVKRAFSQAMLDAIERASDLKLLGGSKVGHHFVSKVSHEASFLRVASAFFYEAEAIYGISVESVSSFWTDEESNQLTDVYLKLHNGKEAGRLFVFQSKDGLRQHLERGVFKRQLDTFGPGGKVLLTSLTKYRQVVYEALFDSEIMSQQPDFLFALPTFDMAFVKYSQSGKEQWYLAILTPNRFYHIKILGQNQGSNSKKFAGDLAVKIDLVKDLFSTQSTHETTGNVIKFYEHETHDNLINKVLPKNVDQDVLHMVRLVWPDADSLLPKALDSLHKKLDELVKTGGNDAPKRYSLWHGATDLNKKRFDHHTGVKIESEESSPRHILIVLVYDNIEFANKAYESDTFSDLRDEMIRNYLADSGFQLSGVDLDDHSSEDTIVKALIQAYGQATMIASGHLKREDLLLYSESRRRPDSAILDKLLQPRP